MAEPPDGVPPYVGYPKGVPMSPSRAGKRERGIWQRRFWEHLIRDNDDLARHVDYLHALVPSRALSPVGPPSSAQATSRERPSARCKPAHRTPAL